jgi:hypothetical protein
MQGSFDHPPIVVRTSRAVSLIGLFVCGGLFSMGIWHLFHPVATWTAEGYFMLVAVGLGSFYFVLNLLRPGALVLSPSGLTWRAPLGSRHWQWKDLDNFRAGSLGVVACDIFSRDSSFAWLRPINKAVSGRHGAFGFGWEGGATAVVALLTDARTRWL